MKKAEFPHESFKAAVEESQLGITEAIAARDKWWVEWLRAHIIISPDALFKDCIIIHPFEFKERIKEIGYEL